MDNLQTLLTGLESIGNISSDAVFIYSFTEKRFIYFNKVAALTFHLDPESLPSSNIIFEKILPEDQQYLTKRYSELLYKGVLTGIEFKLKDDGSQIYFSCDAYVVNENKEIFCLLRDISKLKEHENYIIEYGARKNALLEIILHSLTGPLHVMHNLTKQYTNGSDTKKHDNLPGYLSLIQESTSHCIDIVTDLLKHEHFESAAVYVKKNRFDIVEKLQIIYQQMKESYHDRNFSLKHSAPHLFVMGDDVKFLQIVNILISNAIKFTFTGGKIGIEAKENETHFIIRISDNGIGIPEKLRSFIFDHKTIAGRTGLEGQQSNSLGLSISKKLVSLMGGEIWFESKEGKGSDFYFTIPKD